MSQLMLLGFLGVKAVNTLTPVWLLGIGAIVYLIAIVIAITIFMKLVDRWMNPKYLQ